jgi:hypothetical protein
MGRTSPAKVKRREDEIYRFSSDFLYFARAITLRKIRQLKAARRTYTRRLEGGSTVDSPQPKTWPHPAEVYGRFTAGFH